MRDFLKIIFILGLMFVVPVFGATPENCAASKRGDLLTGKYASLLRCAKNGNCSQRGSTKKKQKVKKPQGESPGSR